MRFVPTDKNSLQSKEYENIFVLGDAANIPTSKAGSVVHFAAEVLYENLLCAIEGRPYTASFDGHSNCYIETGHGKGALIDFNYDTEPLPGHFPFPGIGPFALLKESRMNHYGKLMFRWIYWHILLKGKEMPIDSKMTMAGKTNWSIGPKSATCRAYLPSNSRYRASRTGTIPKQEMSIHAPAPIWT